MDINRFRCPDCDRPIESWVARQPVFRCDGCGQRFQSNYRHSLKRSALFGLLLWLGGSALGALLIDPWQLVLVFAVEFGGLLAFGAAFLLHRCSIRIRRIEHRGEGTAPTGE
ncbi:hypothetical protein [Sedimenticola hydrogenitrophicus]|uniref:hypothetical protein n=1 Tax=Sedimenticola hydrogenitrophicus TaxID=2967975 RepID=UPI0021A59D69|nr:hypothetical protein [Sedimenticola hydrogenitrophicus]